MTARDATEHLAAFDDDGASLVSMFEEHAARHPERLAAVGDGRLTYGELNQAANRIAHLVLARAHGGGTTVALLFQPGVTIVAAILGVLKAGKIYVALDPSYPQARTAYMLEDCEARLLLTDSKHAAAAHRVAQGGQVVLNCDDIDPGTAAANPNCAVRGHTAAVLLYTSGSTGNPKGVLHNHRNVLVEVRNYTSDVGIGPDDRLAVWHSFSFANSVRNLYGALTNGAAVCPYDLPGQGLTPLREWIREYGITMIHTLATTFRAFVDTLPVGTTFPSVRVLRLGGEAINSEDVKKFKRHFPPPCVLMHVMGPTETFSIRRHLIGHDWNGEEGKIPVGYPVPDKEVLLFDENGHRVGAGETGEIAVRSKYLAIGYWRRPQLTDTVFLPDPDGGEERVYFTGDLGVMGPDGCLTHLGRKDFQVKIRGHRVETGEIEAALSKLESVKATVVHATADDDGQQRLVAYVVPAPGKTATINELRGELARILPEFMMPSSFVFLEEFPLLANGKIDRRALPTPVLDRAVLPVPYAAPRDLTESTLTSIWMEVLQVERIGIHDRFLDLGGDSLRATRILSRTMRSFGIELSLGDVIRTETIAQMAELVTIRVAAGSGHSP
jgi:amino acid adenylation domain-containing protein